MTRLIKFLNLTIKYDHIIGVDNLHSLQVWVDTYYAFHRDIQGHNVE